MTIPDPLYILNFFIVFLFSLSVHESAHAWTSERFGDDTGRTLGRISLNPIVHIDPVGTILFPLMGLLGGFGFGWAKPVPVNPMNWREKDKANFWVSAAGPISNVIIAIIVFSILKVLMAVDLVDYGHLYGTGDGVWYPIAQLLKLAIQLNVVLAVFNLIPIPPLDGSHMLESILPAAAREGYADLRPYGFILLIATMAMGGFGYVLNPILLVINRLIS